MNDNFNLAFDYEEEYTETGRIVLEITDNEGNKTFSSGSLNIEMDKLDLLIELCKEYKCSLPTLLELMLAKITKEEAEEMLLSLSM